MGQRLTRCQRTGSKADALSSVTLVAIAPQVTGRRPLEGHMAAAFREALPIRTLWDPVSPFTSCPSCTCCRTDSGPGVRLHACRPGSSSGVSPKKVTSLETLLRRTVQDFWQPFGPCVTARARRVFPRCFIIIFVPCGAETGTFCSQRVLYQACMRMLCEVSALTTKAGYKWCLALISRVSRCREIGHRYLMVKLPGAGEWVPCKSKSTCVT